MLAISRYRVTPGSEVDLSSHDPDSKDGFEGDKDEGEAALPGLNARLADLQLRLWAESRQRLLVVLQAIDTGGKDGTIRHVFRGVNPQGIEVRSFGPPTDLELEHDYLWRIHPYVPRNGTITIFNRSHYEDVLVVRVRDLVPEERWRKRYQHINEFERLLTDEGTTIVKLYLHISAEEQRARLQARLDDPTKRWKSRQGDLEDRKSWDQFQMAYAEALTRTSTENAPWYVVPANRKWYRNLVVSSILIEILERMDPRFPEPEIDLDGLVVS
ncbi:MAG TPA: PPK2 family polyphosphate kinase [Acidimicrobiia bacterium]|nr:PPK2 family polyphosphate kinase [Acidimicrobiia bacterium]